MNQRTIVALALLASSACGRHPSRSERASQAFLRLVAAEDARPANGPDLETVVGFLADEDGFLRSVAVRALGRLENSELVHFILPLLEDPDPSVRAEAANAAAQAVHGEAGEGVLVDLAGRATVERDPVVLAALARSLGRLRLGDVHRARALGVLLDLGAASRGTDGVVLGVALGLESSLRGPGTRDPDLRMLARLEELASYRRGDSRASGDAIRVRGVALAALGQRGRLGAATLEAGLGDPDPTVRAIAARFVDSTGETVRSGLVERALADTSALVRMEAVRALGRLPRSTESCSHLIRVAGSDPSNGVRLLSLDALGQPCPDRRAQQRLLAEVAAGGDATTAWHPRAHAVVSLARLDPAAVARILGALADDGSAFARSYAARAAGLAGREDVLRRLVGDDDPNVRTAAVAALFELRAHAVDDILLAQLGSDDVQLLLTVADRLEGSPLGARAVEPLLGALDRISEARRETSRDARTALVERIGQLGDAKYGDRLTAYLSDYDAVIAEQVANVLEAWTGAASVPTPRPLTRAPLPTLEELRELEGTLVTLHMQGGGDIVIRPLPFLAPTNAHRFVRLARAGRFDGLTFHRWAPNFVIQGGSPNANEYSGDALYSRDEVGLESHWRGTVGLSTRGHDTGDGQIFVNLLDNVRLDHEYTVYGVVVAGMDVVDAVLEGDVIERVGVTLGPGVTPTPW